MEDTGNPVGKIVNHDEKDGLYRNTWRYTNGPTAAKYPFPQRWQILQKQFLEASDWFTAYYRGKVFNLWKARLRYLVSIYILIKVWSPWLYDCLLEAVRTNPGYGMATQIHNFWDFWELFFLSLQGSSAEFLYPKPYLRFWIFEIKYYNSIRANFLSYLNVNVYFITIIHYLNN